MTLTPAAGRQRYCGRFAPSPTGPLHSGSLVSALASLLDARAHGGRWLVRIDDLDRPRTVPGAAQRIRKSLHRLGMRCDAPPLWQSQRLDAYAKALQRLSEAGLIYPCECSRKEIADSLVSARERNPTLAYPGTCRHGLHGKTARAWRIRVPDDLPDQTPAHISGSAPPQTSGQARASAALIRFSDRWQGPQAQNLAREVGDFALKRADGQWAYQLAVVVDDAASHVTHVVRGADLLDSTARQIYLQRCLGLPHPAYMHVPVVCNGAGEKLSKQTNAAALDLSRPLDALYEAARHLGLPLRAKLHDTLEAFYAEATALWAARWLGREQTSS